MPPCTADAESCMPAVLPLGGKGRETAVLCRGTEAAGLGPACTGALKRDGAERAGPASSSPTTPNGRNKAYAAAARRGRRRQGLRPSCHPRHGCGGYAQRGGLSCASCRRPSRGPLAGIPPPGPFYAPSLLCPRSTPGRAECAPGRAPPRCSALHSSCAPLAVVDRRTCMPH